MPKLTIEKKEEIIKKLSEGVSVNELATQFQVSKATIYNVKKTQNKEEIKTKSPSENTSEDRKTESESTSKEETEETESESTSKEETENDITSETEESVSKSSISEIKRLNNSLDKKLENVIPLDEREAASPRVETPIRQRQTMYHTSPLNRVTPVEIPKPFVPPKKLPAPEEITDEKRKNKILKIRQYINYFDEKLKTVRGANKESFLKSLFYKSDNELSIILEEIHVTLSTSQSLPIMMKMFETLIISLEGICGYFGFDLTGLRDDVKNDDSFRECLMMLACEYIFDLDPTRKLIYLTVQSAFLRYNINSTKNVQVRDVPIEEVEKLKEQYNKL